ncbi:Pfs, NACHT, and Ankyrin domain protein [Talaromyces stipitatus ATCC 10500]|uniref:Pfs, NACHT, and Ankyrin domain protein n=1 Tax=Talaromyces stipitatus (strain ATCC 10500 / CBS 375.48 / QM 6759 / NRRL 1006) TaxID=441959 RepID=B8MT53_TALSN|nr:Pfs, NACHT, and Ankyrin domain protein [Talaromyces stipitatus ATCC 10500]EED12256.1 Pfs, NACHT, and Ankyrin domain protein [Talaromyces stipitatus ATCC 10500]
MTIQRSHRDYTIAWISALPLEMAAAKAVLDEIHCALPQSSTDRNAYTLGRLCDHNVAVACLPSGIYGVTSAATVLAQMLSTFSSLRFGLMVGIGGGVPSKFDIRLGDVVVSKPNRTENGVIQYDLGKTLSGGRFQRTGSLNKPPHELLTAISQIDSDQMMGKQQVQQIIHDTLAKNEQIRGQFSRPPDDWLFCGTYDHKTITDDCSACDRSQLVSRAPRPTDEPQIHYGLIASGNQVMKDAKTRDLIAQELDILCFEMEAAGLMDQLPCLVIRGICDYCDSHKSKQWQGYAAVTAAAYAKGLLKVVPVADHKAQQEQHVSLTEEEKSCLQSLFITDPAEDRNALKRRKGDRTPGTCSWILETDELKHWLALNQPADQEETRILWLRGNPGTGKSTMAITLTEELPNQPYFSGKNKAFAYFFCDSSAENRRTATAILRGILFQLINEWPILMKYLFGKYEGRKEKLFTSFDALWAVLIDMGHDSTHSGIYCVIDALDECEPESQQIILNQMNQTFNSRNSKHSTPSNIHILITSRPYPEVGESLSFFRYKDFSSYQAFTNDLKRMIQQRVDDLRGKKKYPESVATKVSRILEDKAEGTFLWVGIACDELARVPSIHAEKTLKTLPRGLHSLYQQLLNAAIASDYEDDQRVIVQMLSFVSFARRPLSLAELSEACQLYPDEDEDSRLQFTRDLVDMCRLMIVIQAGHVQLLHKSVKDFLVKERDDISDLKANTSLAHRCIDHVIDAFLNYSVQHWPEHASLSRTEFVIGQKQEEFFQLQSKMWKEWLRQYNTMQTYSSNHLDIGFSTLHAAARWGIPQLISRALNSMKAGHPGLRIANGGRMFVDSQFRTSRGVTPLEVAAGNGQLFTMSLLLEKTFAGLKVAQSIVIAAAQNKDRGKQVLELLLDQRGDQIQITEEVVKAAAGNEGDGNAIMTLLLDRRGDQIQITEEVVKVAAGNEFQSHKLLALLHKRYNTLPTLITDTVLLAAASCALSSCFSLIMVITMDSRTFDMMNENLALRKAGLLGKVKVRAVFCRRHSPRYNTADE